MVCGLFPTDADQFRLVSLEKLQLSDAALKCTSLKPVAQWDSDLGGFSNSYGD